MKGLNGKVDGRNVEMLRKHYLTLFEKTSEITSENLWNPSEPKLDDKFIRKITENHQNHSRSINIKEIIKETSLFHFPGTSRKT